jgi:hypothetical protein
MGFQAWSNHGKFQILFNSRLKFDASITSLKFARTWYVEYLNSTFKLNFIIQIQPNSSRRSGCVGIELAGWLMAGPQGVVFVDV